MVRSLFSAIAVALAVPAWAADEFAAAAGHGRPRPAETVCDLIDAAASEHGLPVDFFTRLIWKESRFQPDAVSPKGAQGIAQFMPATAARRGLADPFDPIEAIPASARYLKDLAGQFGNLGLAAAAYNAGEERVAGWLAGARSLPGETRDYVWSITGSPAEDWAAVEVDPSPVAYTFGRDAEETGEEATAPATCAEVAALLSKPGAGSALVARIPRGEWAPWGAQVAGNFSADRAMASYAALQRRQEELLAGIAPMVVSSVVRSRGAAPLRQVRLPAGTRAEAERLCERLKAAGEACVVMKNAP